MTKMHYTLAILIGIFFVCSIIYFILSFILKRFKTKGSLAYPAGELYRLLAPMYSLTLSLLAAAALPLLQIPKDFHPLAQHAAEFWIITSIAWLLVKMTRIARDIIISRNSLQQKDNLGARKIYTQIRVIENIINVAIVIVAFSIFIMTFPKIRQIGVSVLASAGVLGIILGFAAQKTLGNLIAGIQIAMAQPIRMDDVVIVENEWGWIEEITLTYVVVRLWDLRRLIVPISYFMEKPFQNWTRTSAEILAYIYIYADYSVPVKEVRDELTRILEKSPNWDKKVNVLQVTNATEKTVELRALMSAVDSPTAWNLRCEVREKLITFLQERFPKSLPLVRVEMKSQ